MGIVATPFSLLDASPIRLWDPTTSNVTIDTGVSQLNDTSGNGAHLTQGTASKQPSHSASDADFNGYPSLTFDGSDDVINNDVSLQLGTDYAYVFVVCRSTGTASNQFLITDRGTANAGVSIDARSFAIIEDADGDVALVGGTDVRNDDTTHLLELHWNPDTDTLEFFLDGTSQGTETDATVDSSISGANNVQLGSAGGSHFFSGKISLAVVYNSALSADQLSKIRAECNKRVP